MFSNREYQWTVEREEAREVLINERAGVVFRYRPCIGTQMEGGIVVFVVTAAGAVCGHFQPPADSLNLDDLRTEDFTNRLIDYTKTYREYFQLDGGAALIFYDSGGRITSYSQATIMKTALANANIAASGISIIPYRHRGTAFVASIVDSKGSKIQMHLDGTPVS